MIETDAVRVQLAREVQALTEERDAAQARVAKLDIIIKALNPCKDCGSGPHDCPCPAKRRYYGALVKGQYRHIGQPLRMEAQP